jgi:5-methylcytosine-specific restriction endonuclease McrA
MAVTGKQQATFMHRTQQAFQAVARRARTAGQALDYRLDDLRALVFANLGERHCPYCRGLVTVENFALDHRNPIERTGSYIFHNLAVVCEGCAVAKSSLDYVEFKELMDLVRTWSVPVQKHFREQLRVGGSQVSPLRFRWPAGCATADIFPPASAGFRRSRWPAGDLFTTESTDIAKRDIKAIGS